MQPNEQCDLAVGDRRMWERRPASGGVHLLPAAQAGGLIAARLVDISENGFCASHPNPGLHSGEEVFFCHSSASGIARVIWNHSVDGHWLTGFFVIAREPV